MKTNNEKGRNLTIAISVYLLVKCIVNMVVGGGFDIVGLITAIAYAGFMFTGLEFVNYVICGLLAITVLRHIGYNVTHLPSSLLYLIEAALDIGCAVLLVIQSDIKEHFKNKWNENLFS